MEESFHYRPNFFGDGERRGGGEMMRVRVCVSDVRNGEDSDGESHEKVEEKSSGASSNP